MVFIVAHTEHFTFSIRIYERNRERISCLIYTPVVAQSERPIVCGVVDGSPEVDDLEAVLEQLWSVGRGEVFVREINGVLGSLVAVDEESGLARIFNVIQLFWAVAADD